MEEKKPEEILNDARAYLLRSLPISCLTWRDAPIEIVHAWLILYDAQLNLKRR